MSDTMVTSQEMLDTPTQQRILKRRQEVGAILTGATPGTISILGACALVKKHFDITTHEGDRLARANGGPLYLQRQCFWKPRSNPDSWWGEETTAPEATREFVAAEAKRHGLGAAEIGAFDHMHNYGASLVLGWFGGRNKDKHLKQRVALYDPSLPLAVKNPLSGEIDATLQEIEELKTLRGPGAAPIVLLYRGGSNAQTPDLWEKQLIRAFEATNGQLIVDLAHGAEMAHDPGGAFEKSAAAQHASTAHALALAQSGYAAVAYMSEMSDAPSPVDPPIPFNLDMSVQLHNARLQQYTP